MLPISICCKLLGSQVLLKGSKQMEVIGHHAASWTCGWLQCNSWIITDNAPNNPNLLSIDFYLFGSLKKHLAGEQFATYANIKQAITSRLKTLDSDFFIAKVQALVPQ